MLLTAHLLPLCNEHLPDYVYSRLPETARRFRAVLAATVDERE
jgi:hypothetical protein